MNLPNFLLERRLITEKACWEFTGKRDDQNRGRWNDKIVSRIVLSLKLGRELEEGENALHTCDNPPCFNPDHLYAGTQKQNVEDCLKRYYDGDRAWGNAVNERFKTHCNKGHLLDGRRSNGKRYCLTCNRDKNYKGLRPRRGPYK